MTKEWYSAAELAGLPGMQGTVQGVNIAAKRGNWRVRPRTGRGGGNEYHISSLPFETQAHLRGVVVIRIPAGPASPLVRWLASFLRPVIKEALRTEARS